MTKIRQFWKLNEADTNLAYPYIAMNITGRAVVVTKTEGGSGYHILLEDRHGAVIRTITDESGSKFFRTKKRAKKVAAKYTDTYKFAEKKQGDYWSSAGRFENLLNAGRKFVPKSGEADTLYGELNRVANNLTYDLYNNGFANSFNGAQEWRTLELAEIRDSLRWLYGETQRERLDMWIDQMEEYQQQWDEAGREWTDDLEDYTYHEEPTPLDDKGFLKTHTYIIDAVSTLTWAMAMVTDRNVERKSLPRIAYEYGRN